MKILIVSPEVSPYAKTSGLADATSMLARSLRKLGHDARLILPCYKNIDDNGFSLRKGRKSIEVDIDGTAQKGLLRQTLLEGVPVYFIENRDYFHRDGLYGNGQGDYADNAQRFGFFCHAVLQLLRRMDFRPDVLHLHGWQTGLIPVLLRTALKGDPFYAHMGTLFTLHGLDETGLFPGTNLNNLGLDNDELAKDLALGDGISFLKGGLLYADQINTLSETYRDELHSAEFGGEFAPLLRRRSATFHGILNGIDTRSWDPSLDMNIARPFNADNLNGKKANKRALQKETGLALEPLVPLVGLVAPLSVEKGLDLIAAATDELLKRGMQLIVAGRGEPALERQLAALRDHSPEQAQVFFSNDAGLARRIFAGSDIFLMPSRLEPSGLEQIIALRYGAVPVVHRTGGLNDTIIDIDERPRQGNGFVFEQASVAAMLGALDRALAAYENRRQWLKLVKRCMTQDFSWTRAAEKYVELYRKTREQRLY
ncbi:glycogen synthase [Geoalkalibacter halelectricus]|uniref:Glycogen synthase n=1 Tax=Geoalkalibacter halelectricus TaxID=2847045 RepID=A0ABY5ZND1_9BACT|nr:glycogen/starch synthase [Geoalkalibacter halelectricus]MDO3377590.1 glycogen synthase [Geoalkalibacter halelectricus]UWZ80652.1 glycogen synthase [Geoalkalibacter halelectricus]